MKEIVVISGKGGTGKTSITAAFAYLAQKEVVVADCDVDAANMHLLMKPDIQQAEDFYSGKIANINKNCTDCGLCQEKCRFEAIIKTREGFEINPLNCEGCGYCKKICPSDGIVMKDNLSGRFYISKSRMDNILVHAHLRIGAENSGKLVSKVRLEAKKIAQKENIQYVLIDGTPGIGCPVVASITGSDLVVIVTESTLSGFHDFKRAYELTDRFKIPAVCIINKYDLNLKITTEIENYLKEHRIKLITKLPYTKLFSDALTNAQTIIEYDKENQMHKVLSKAWQDIKNA